MKTTTTQTVIAYIRVSTDEQRHGPEAQRRAILAWAAQAGVEIGAWYEDIGVGGSTPVDGCPGLLGALAALGEGATLVAHKRDRLARDVLKAQLLERAVQARGARLHVVEGGGAGDRPEDAFLAHILDAVAQLEVSQIRARTRAGMAAARAKGVHVGRPGLAQRDPELHREIVRLHREEGRTPSAIARALTAAGVEGRTWRPRDIRAALGA